MVKQGIILIVLTSYYNNGINSKVFSFIDLNTSSRKDGPMNVLSHLV